MTFCPVTFCPTSIFFNGVIVSTESEQKQLGLILTENLSFTKHVYEKIKKADKHVGLIKKASMYLPYTTLNQLYKTFARTHLDYCDVIYHQPAKITNQGQVLNTLMSDIERVQYRGALAVTGTWKGSSQLKLYEELGWESLSDRRKKQRQVLLFKIINNLTPAYLRD